MEIVLAFVSGGVTLCVFLEFIGSGLGVRKGVLFFVSIFSL
jgi:hypothetical protein